MSRSPLPERRPSRAATAGGPAVPEACSRALEQARECALRAPSGLGTRAWQLALHPDRLVLRADRTRQQTDLDPTGRRLVESAGTAVFTARVALAARGWATDVDRFPRPEDPDLLGEIHPVRGTPDPGLAVLAPCLHRLRAGRGRGAGGELPGPVLRRLGEIAGRDGVLLVPVVDQVHRRLVARLARQADDDARTTLLLATRTDDAHAWLRTGEALQHILLELARLARTAVPLPQPIEVPLARVQLRAALAWDAHPQLLLGIGAAGRAR